MSIKVKQRDITDCGAACLASVVSYYNLNLPMSLDISIAFWLKNNSRYDLLNGIFDKSIF